MKNESLAYKGFSPQPTQLKVIKGTATKKERTRRELRINPKHGPPTPPDFLDNEAKLEWEKVCEILAESGVITKIDHGIFSAYCVAYSRWKAAEEMLAECAKTKHRGFMIETTNGNLVQNPLVGVANQAMHTFVRYAAELGMTPGARARITINPPEQDDPAEKYLS